MVWSVMTILHYTVSVIMTVTLPLDLAYMHVYGIVGKARWADLSTSHHIKPEPLSDGLMSCTQRVPNDAVCIFSHEYLFETAKSN